MFVRIYYKVKFFKILKLVFMGGVFCLVIFDYRGFFQVIENLEFRIRVGYVLIGNVVVVDRNGVRIQLLGFLWK